MMMMIIMMTMTMKLIMMMTMMMKLMMMMKTVMMIMINHVNSLHRNGINIILA